MINELHEINLLRAGLDPNIVKKISEIEFELMKIRGIISLNLTNKDSK